MYNTWSADFTERIFNQRPHAPKTLPFLVKVTMEGSYICVPGGGGVSPKRTHNKIFTSPGAFASGVSLGMPALPFSQSINPRSRRIWWHYCFPLELVARSIDRSTNPPREPGLGVLFEWRTDPQKPHISGTKSPNVP